MIERDLYQERYLEHQRRKRDAMREQATDYTGGLAFLNRRSVRRFKPRRLALNESALLLDAVRLAPSSCNRQAIYVSRYSGETGLKDRLQGWLVGGANWCASASEIWLFFADVRAYKSPVERSYMPLLDGAAAVMSVAYVAHTIGLATCWINPHVRAEADEEFDRAVNPRMLLLASALAIGEAAGHQQLPPKRAREDVLYENIPS